MLITKVCRKIIYFSSCCQLSSILSIIELCTEYILQNVFQNSLVKLVKVKLWIWAKVVKCYLIIAADHPLGFSFEHTEDLFLIQVRCYNNETKEMFLKRRPISDTEWMVLQWFYICVKCLPEYCWSMFLHIADITVPVQEKVWSSLSDRLLVYYHN